MSDSPKVTGFAVIYRWKVNPAKVDQFKLAWATLTHEIRNHAGGLGSRLHVSVDGTWYAYAQWPSRQAWQSASVTTEASETAHALLADAIEERLPEIELVPEADLLVPTGID
jgi:quinol monooxygenase YgiN